MLRVLDRVRSLGSGDPMGRAIAGLPRVRGLPLVGTLPDLLQDAPGLLARASEELGGVCDVGFPWWPIVLVTEPAAIEEVLVGKARHFIKDKGTRELGLVLGRGLLTSEGDLWRKQRRLVQPAFRRERVEAYGAVMVEAATRWTSRVLPASRLNLHEEMMELTLEIVGKTLLGVDITTNAGKVGDALHAVAKRFETVQPGFLRIMLGLPTPTNRAFARGKATLDALISSIVAERRASGADTGDLLSMLLLARTEDGQPMDEQLLRDEVMTLLIAGHETTALALSWAFALLAQHPAVDEELHASIAEVIGQRPPTVADLPRLGAVDEVVREALRIYPPAWAVGREATDDVEIGGFALPAGTQLWMSPFAVQRSPRFFDAPLAFRPARWRGGELAARLPKYAYFPFGGGPRLCMGVGFAMQEAVLLLAAIAQRFRFRLVPGQPVQHVAAVTLRPKAGVWVDVLPR